MLTHRIRGHHRVDEPGRPRASRTMACLALVLPAATLSPGESGAQPFFQGNLQPPSQLPGPIMVMPARWPQDSAEFANGDKLSGNVEAIEQGTVSFRLDLIQKTTEFPTGNLSKLTFAGPPDPLPQFADAVHFRDGSHLCARVTRLTSDGLELDTGNPDVPMMNGGSPPANGNPEGEVSAEVSKGRDERTILIPRGEIAGIGFFHPNDVLFERDFSKREEMGFVVEGGSWDIEKGQLVQASPQPFCRAYVKLIQTGMMRYEWTMDLSKSQVAGLAFFVSRCDTRYGESGYMVTVRGRQVYFYRIMTETRHQARRDEIRVAGPLVSFRVDYDPDSGEIVLQVEREILMRLVDPSPIRSGRYVVLHTEGKAAFDDVRVTQLLGGIEGTVQGARCDSILLSNGDRVSGEITEISQQVVIRDLYSGTETPIPRRKVRAVVLSARSEKATGGDRPSLPRFSLWDGSVVYGNVAAMDDKDVTLRTAFAPRLIVSRSNIRLVDFDIARPQEAPAVFPLEEMITDSDKAAENPQNIEIMVNRGLPQLPAGDADRENQR